MSKRKKNRQSSSRKKWNLPIALVVAVLLFFSLLALLQYFGERETQRYRLEILEKQRQLIESEVRLEELKKEIGEASESRVFQLLQDRADVMNVARTTAAELMSLIKIYERRLRKSGKPGDSVIAKAKTLLSRTEPLLNSVIDFTHGTRRGHEWNNFKGNTIVVQQEAPMPLKLEYELLGGYSGWSIDLHGENWTAYNGSNSALVITLVDGSTCPRFKLDVNTKLKSQPGFFRQVDISNQDRVRMKKDGRCEIMIPLHDMRSLDGISVLEKDYLSGVIELAIVFESERTRNGTLVVESFRLANAASQ